MHFTPGDNANTSVENQGTITAKDAGLVGLVAPNVQNGGVITAKLGKVQLASGDSFTLDLYGDKLLEIGVSDAVKQQLVQTHRRPRSRRRYGEADRRGGPQYR